MKIETVSNRSKPLALILHPLYNTPNQTKKITEKSVCYSLFATPPPLLTVLLLRGILTIQNMISRNDLPNWETFCRIERIRTT